MLKTIKNIQKMKKPLYLLIIWTCLVMGIMSAKQVGPHFTHLNKKQKVYEVEASCGSCQFDMPGDDCQLAIKFQDKKYYVVGPNINDYGGSHATNGFCQVVRKAQVQGKVVQDKFVVTYFKLLP